MSVVITGANGQLGQELQILYPDARPLTRDDLDLRRPDAVAAFDWDDTRLILNAAAYTKVDHAEEKAGWLEAWGVNALGVAALAGIAHDRDIPLVTVSTDYVFDGAKEGEYSETDLVNPQSGYGCSKAAGELALRGDKQLNVRTSWVIGKGPNFLRSMNKFSKEYAKLTVVDDQKGRPTFAKDLAEAIKALVDAEAHGTFHFSNSGDIVSWYELTEALMDEIGSETPVEPTTTAEFSASRTPWAPRPKNSAFDLRKVSQIYSPRDWRLALSEYVKQELQRE